MAVEYEVRVRVGGKLGGIKAKPSDLSVDGPVGLTTLLPPAACDRDDARELRSEWNGLRLPRCDPAGGAVLAGFQLEHVVPGRPRRNALRLAEVLRLPQAPPRPALLRRRRLDFGAQRHPTAAAKDLAAVVRLRAEFYRRAAEQAGGLSAQGAGVAGCQRAAQPLRAGVPGSLPAAASRTWFPAAWPQMRAGGTLDCNRHKPSAES